FFHSQKMNNAADLVPNQPADPQAGHEDDHVSVYDALQGDDYMTLKDLLGITGCLSYMGNGTSGKISFGLVLASEDCSSLQA
ncbi:hypothetical protein MKW98_003007, partial [Papaver atlanticum]